MLTPILYKPFTTLGASVSPNFYFEVVTVDSGTSATSVTVTPSGGTAPYTYSWNEISTAGDGDIGATAGTSATTSFTWSGLTFIGASQSSDFQCQVTDALSQTTFVNINAFFLRGS